MCILIHQPKDSCFTSAQLQDFYSKNPDGFGAIVKKGETVEVIKSVGSLAEIEDLYYDQVALHESVIHFRMKTHGEIDIANCHPYEVVPGIWMAHNGILSTGNAADPKMSDTWHYIQDYLKPVLQSSPDLITNPAFLKLVGGHIGGSNKFAFMNEKGEVGIVNRTSGYDFWDLANKDLTVWYSNTYAWNPYQHGFMSYPKPVTTYGNGSYYGSSPTWRAWDAFDREERQGTLSLDSTSKKKTGKKSMRASKKQQRKAKSAKIKRLTGEALKKVVRQSFNAISLEGYDGALRWVEDHPMAAMHFLHSVLDDNVDPEDISDLVNYEPAYAADDIYMAWESMEDVLLEVGEIEGRLFKDPVGGNEYDYV